MRSRPRHHHGEDEADRSLSQNHHNVFRLRIDQLHALETGVHRFDEAGLIEGNALGNFFDAVLDDPVHDADVLRESAACRFISRRDADFLVNRALGIQLALAIKTLAARNVVKDDDTVTRDVARDTRAYGRNHTRRLMTVNARRRQQVVRDFL